MNFLCDAHTHFVTTDDIEQRIKYNIPSLISNADPDEIHSLIKMDLPSFLIPTFGIHPWGAGKFKVKNIESILNKVSVVGEIGMDSVWCDVPLDIQQKIFEEQLEIASDLKKPVILHTKGQEKEIASIILKYPNRYLVHWYSCSDHLDKYIEQNCYFSIGPDVWWNPATRNVAKKVSDDKILTETDGLNSVQWAYDEAPSDKKILLPKIPGSAKETLELVIRSSSAIRNMSYNEFAEKTYHNLMNGFLGKEK